MLLPYVFLHVYFFVYYPFWILDPLNRPFILVLGMFFVVSKYSLGISNLYPYFFVLIFLTGNRLCLFIFSSLILITTMFLDMIFFLFFFFFLVLVLDFSFFVSDFVIFSSYMYINLFLFFWIIFILFFFLILLSMGLNFSGCLRNF
uniref:NADH dehydrogenase subunit 6 n=1 Tax=Heliconema longissimum TaxID=657295 RepID=G4V228_9BILA|nr:NADH dehydrogenase subunit 6 [Heliconema longissimum]ACV96727.1 NADH dehydrogenase subunit 6 [Heliconema longissimum]